MMDMHQLSSTDSAPKTRTGVAKKKACLQCTRSRRYGRSSPQCLRCLDKGAVCQYPPLRHRLRHPAPSSQAQLYQESDRPDLVACPSPPCHDDSIAKPALTSTSPSRRFSSIQTSVRNPRDHPRAAGSKSGSNPWDSLANDRWFLTADTFVKLHDTGGDSPARLLCYQDRVLGDEMVEFLGEIQKWIQEWAVDGHSPAVHRHLYSGGYMPECVEDAYTVLATYHSSTNPRIRKTALQIADRRASRLIAFYRVPQLQLGYPEECESVVIDTRTHLARTLALLAYQVMGLFDTDIRVRSNAENYIPILNCWALQMLESAQLNCLTSEMETVTPFNIPNTSDEDGQDSSYQADLDPSIDEFLANPNADYSSFIDKFLPPNSNFDSSPETLPSTRKSSPKPNSPTTKNPSLSTPSTEAPRPISMRTRGARRFRWCRPTRRGRSLRRRGPRM